MSPAKTYRVLFVEDAFDEALLVKSFLSGAGGYAVTHAQDGDLAIQLLADQDWDIVVTDLNLPGADGFEVIRVARAKSEDRPILATTGYKTPEYQDEALRAGANNVLHKPLEKDDFLGAVRSLLDIKPRTQKQATILAIGGLAGDVEMGCGGTLMKAVGEGSTVVVVPLAHDELDAAGAAFKATKKACAVMGFELIVDKAALGDTQGRMAVIEKAISDLRPSRLYLPAMSDNHPARMEAFRVGQAVSGPVDTVLGYQTGSTGVDFRPSRFVVIRKEMAVKEEALALFGAAGAGRLDLHPDLVHAYARYWGRMRQFDEVEAFEVIKGRI